MPAPTGRKIISQNKKAYHDYFVDEKYEAGVQLFGTEVKSVRQGAVNLKDSYCYIHEGELYASGIHISPYEKQYDLFPAGFRDKTIGRCRCAVLSGCL